MQKTQTFKLKENDAEKIYSFLLSYGEHLENPNQYVLWQIKGKSFSAVMYKSGKLVLQVSDTELEGKVQGVLSEKVGKIEPHIGSDEVGKGDYFGPLIVCSAYISDEEMKKIKDYEVTDSKELTDEDIFEIGGKLREELYNFVKIIKPKEYNDLNREYNNVAILLAKAHYDVASNLNEVLKKNNKEVSFVSVDQFSKSKKRLENEFVDLKLPLRQFHKGESDIAIACASIIARYEFLKEMSGMNEEYGFKFPFGATHVISSGKKFVKLFGEDQLYNVAKVSFKTTEKIRGKKGF